MSKATFPDHFSAGAAGYAAFRPHYPDRLFAYLASLCVRHHRAWDCATGSGQAAVALTRHFDHVVASDASASQVAHAARHPRVDYLVAVAERSPVSVGSMDLVTVAQSLHWFARPAFYAEAAHALASHGLLAVWCYTNVEVDEPIGSFVRDFYGGACGPYWPPERALVEDGYRTIEFPFVDERTSAEQFEITAELTLAQLVGYIRSWSATQRLAAATGGDPVSELEETLRTHWGSGGGTRSVRWPISLRVGRPRSAR